MLTKDNIIRHHTSKSTLLWGTKLFQQKNEPDHTTTTPYY
jgi:hypothetical protein